VFARVLTGLAIFFAGLLAGLALARLPQFTRASGPKQPPVATEEVSITFSARVDGSDRFVFTTHEAWNEHARWERPTQVRVNEAEWTDLSQAPPGWLELAPQLDLRRARILTREGRDAIALETIDDGFELHVADTLPGAGDYKVTIAIPRK
jgi:hypothetical protein